MSALEPAATPDVNGRLKLPNFPVVMRGYDREQVQAFFQDLVSRLAAERRRAEETERTLAQVRLEVTSLQSQPPPSFEHLGSEAAKVLEQAGKSAKLLVQEAKSRGEALVREAEVEAGELIERAEQRATELEEEASTKLGEATGERDRILAEVAAEAEKLRAQTQEEARVALANAHEESARIRQQVIDEQSLMSAQTEQLRESRDQMLDYLGRIHSNLGALLAEAVEVPAATTEPVTEEAVAEADANLDEWPDQVERASEYAAEPPEIEPSAAPAGQQS